MLLLSLSALGDQVAHMRTQMTQIATALSDGNADDAMSSFDKSFANYDKLRNYFEALANSFRLSNELEITDEEDSENETKLIVQWTLTITDPATNSSDTRDAELKVRLVRAGKKWKIVDFSPIELFNPQRP